MVSSAFFLLNSTQMKILGSIILILTVLVSCNNLEGYETETFTVYGNCGMCKKTIERSLHDVKGIETGEWDMSTDKMTVTFDPNVISLGDIHKKIAGVGYDTEEERAPDEVYEKLHSCCQYDRPE